jgi:protein-disulfide isomerase
MKIHKNIYKSIASISALAIVTSFPFIQNANAEISEADFKKAFDQYMTKDENVGKIGDSLAKYFQKKQMEEQKKAAAQEEKSISDQIKNPVKIEIGKSPVKGAANAPITIVEFSDFQCPFCKKGYETMEKLLKEYPTDVKVVFKNLPLPFHNEAKPAAQAALAAGKQGKFWEMHSKLFENQDQLNADNYAKFAGELGLNVEQFKKDTESKEIADQIEADMKIANANGVQGTPGFFVGGVQVKGARPVSDFKELIEKIKKERK